MLGSDLHNRYTCKHFATWEYNIRKLELSDLAEHMRRSAKTVIAIAKKRKGEAGAIDQSSEQDFSLSTLALLGLLPTYITDTCTAVAESKRVAADRAALLLRAVLCLCCDAECVDIVMAGMRIVLHIVGGYVLLAPVFDHSPCLQRVLARFDERAQLAELLIALARIARRPASLSAATLEAARVVLVDLVGGIAVRFEIVVARGLSERALVALPVLRLRSNRPRRVSVARTRAVSEAVAATQAFAGQKPSSRPTAFAPELPATRQGCSREVPATS